MPEKFISLTFDDGWKSAVERARPLLEKYGMPASFYIISNRLGDEHQEYMNADDLRALGARGHEIGVHTRSHKHLPELSNEEIWTEIKGGLDDLRALGFAPRTFAYPYGDWNPYVVKQVREAGFFGARSIEQGFNDEKTNHLLLKAFPVREEHSAEGINSQISEFMKASEPWLVLYFHQIESAEVLRERKWIYGTTPAVLEGILSFLKAQKADMLTLEQGLVRLTLH